METHRKGSTIRERNSRVGSHPQISTIISKCIDLYKRIDLTKLPSGRTRKSAIHLLDEFNLSLEISEGKVLSVRQPIKELVELKIITQKGLKKWKKISSLDDPLGTLAKLDTIYHIIFDNEAQE